MPSQKPNNNIIILLLLLTGGLISCKNSKKEMDNLEVTIKYYAVLDKSNVSGITPLLADSLLTKEMEHDYEQTFSLKEYIEWLKWDSVFDPTYEILEIEQENGSVKALISKTDKRISFLHEEPIVWNEIIQFDNGKIIQLERTYTVFNESLFIKNRDELVRWIDKNHPELSGFLNEQTEFAGLKYLKAIEFYRKNNSVLK